MNNKPDCHPDTPESGQQVNRQENLDTCRTCKHFTTYRPAWHNGGYGLCKLNKVINCTDHSCPHHEPANAIPENDQ